VLNKRVELVVVHKNDKDPNILIHIGAVDRNGLSWAVGSVVDITELRPAENEV
jgi:hypothetical protein